MDQNNSFFFCPLRATCGRHKYTPDINDSSSLSVRYCPTSVGFFFNEAIHPARKLKYLRHCLSGSEPNCQPLWKALLISNLSGADNCPTQPALGSKTGEEKKKNKKIQASPETSISFIPACLMDFLHTFHSLHYQHSNN